LSYFYPPVIFDFAEEVQLRTSFIRKEFYGRFLSLRLINLGDLAPFELTFKVAKASPGPSLCLS
jgi:hypothetical protein